MPRPGRDPVQLAIPRDRVLPGTAHRGVLALGVALMVASILPAFLAAPSRLTSDESLYSAEALNIATGKGLTYTTGDPITHRPPLYPALLALEFKLGGVSLESASWLPRAATVVNAVLV